MGGFHINFRRDMGTYLFGLWVVIFGVLILVGQEGLMREKLVNVLMGILLIIAGVFHLIEL